MVVYLTTLCSQKDIFQSELVCSGRWVMTSWKLSRFACSMHAASKRYDTPRSFHVTSFYGFVICNVSLGVYGAFTSLTCSQNNWITTSCFPEKKNLLTLWPSEYLFPVFPLSSSFVSRFASYRDMNLADLRECIFNRVT
jgi:hypothetical protein